MDDQRFFMELFQGREGIVDEIIIGVVKKSKVQKFLFGSNAQYVLLHAPCMVIAVK